MSDEIDANLMVEDILACDVSDEALEAAASADHTRILTIAFCTQEWNYCYPT
jgi:hypothetical protein